MNFEGRREKEKERKKALLMTNRLTTTDTHDFNRKKTLRRL
jgi:hypothetical protein